MNVRNDMHRHSNRAALDRERGQILVMFALSITAVIAMVGLVLDGSGAYSQKRVEQNASDLASLAGANAYMNTSGSIAAKTTAAINEAQASSAKNGYANGVGGTTVTVTVTHKSSGADVKVDITSPHQNSFARIIPGNAYWDVSVTATSWAGLIDTATGAAPWTMSIEAFNEDSTPKYGITNPQNFGSDCGDYPEDGLDISWTDYNGYDNVNSSEVKNILDGNVVVTATFDLSEGGQYLGQHNQGCHTTLFDDVNANLAGTAVPIPIVGPPTAPDTTCKDTAYTNGCFKGWAMFYVTSASGGSDKFITGYFLENFRSAPLTVGDCTPAQIAAGECGAISVTSDLDNYHVVLKD
jgi:Flp pilus assembly protein TadG